jgi:hypothetical protein
VNPHLRSCVALWTALPLLLFGLQALSQTPQTPGSNNEQTGPSGSPPVNTNGQGKTPKKAPPANGQGKTPKKAPPANGQGKMPKKGPPANGDNGIYVDAPKVYDDASLEALFNATQANIAKLNAFDSASLLKGIGATQGATADQSQFAAQVSVSRTTGPPPTSSTTTNPTIPSVSSSSSLPSSFAPSSLDLLDEETQLNYQLVNLQLLLQGALSDQIVPGTSRPKPHLTLGFPISVNVPTGFQYQQAVAEVEVSVCSPAATLDPPSVVALLPQAKTYNVANIVNKSTQLGAGAVAGIVNFGASFLHGHQTYYLVRDQDTLAVQRSSQITCPQPGGKGATFAWQFKPVLGERVVRDGLRQTLVQLSFTSDSDDGQPSGSPTMIVRTGWRRYDPKTGRVGDPITKFIVSPAFDPPFYTNAPAPNRVGVEDNGDGTLTVEVAGAFKAGTFVRIGKTVIDSSASTPANAGFEQLTFYTKFTAAAVDVAIKGANLVTREGAECPIVQGQSPCTTAETATQTSETKEQTATRPPPPPTVKAQAQEQGPPAAPGTPAPAPGAAAAQPAAPQASVAKPAPALTSENLKKITSMFSVQLNRFTFAAEQLKNQAPAKRWTVTTSPFSDSSSLVKLQRNDGRTGTPDFGPLRKPVVLIGSKLFGLLDAPYRDFSADYSALTLVASNDLLQSSAAIAVKTLFKDNPTEDDQILIPHATDALQASGTQTASVPDRSGFAITAVKFLFTAPDDSPAPSASAAATAAGGAAPAAGNPAGGAPPTPKLNYYAVTGSHLEKLAIIGPAGTRWRLNTATEATFKIFGLNDQQTNLQRIVFRDGSSGPIIVQDMPPVAAAAAPAPPKNSVDAQTTPPTPGTAKLTVTGYGFDQIVSIRYLDMPLQFSPPKPAPTDPKTNPNGDKKTLDITLPTPSPLNPPGLNLTFVYADKSMIEYSVPVAAPK